MKPDCGPEIPVQQRIVKWGVNNFMIGGNVTPNKNDPVTNGIFRRHRK